MKKIAIFCHNHTLSGANLALIDWLEKRKNEFEFVIIIPKRNKDFINELNKLNVKIIIGYYKPVFKNINKISLRRKLKESIKIVYNCLFEKIIIRRLSNIIKDNNIDLIHSNSFAIVYGAIIAMNNNIEHVWHIREFMEDDHGLKYYKKIDKKIFMLCKYSNAIFISNAIKEYYLKKYIFKRYCVIYDNVKFEEKNIGEMKKFSFRNIKCIFVGTISKNKGIKDAIDAIDYINKENKYNILLDIYGKGEDETYLKKYVEDNQINNIYFKEFDINVNFKRKYYDIALICSNMEAFGRVTIEGMYYNNIIIASDSGSNLEIIQDNINGFLYENHNIKSLGNAIVNIANMSETEIINMKKYAQKQALKLYNREISREIFEYYKLIIYHR